MNLLSFRYLRVFLLLLLLAFAAFYTQGQRLNTNNWLKPLEVVIFPINGDETEETESYINRLLTVDFHDIDEFMLKQSKKYDLHLDFPTRVRLGKQIENLPPASPHFDDSVIQKMLWSLKLRYWAWQNTPDDQSNYNRVRIFVIYHQGEPNQALPHSLGLQKGLLGVVHAFADEEQTSRNHVVIAHELLHTVGATDKYGDKGLPVFPHGFAEPDKEPLYPQRRAEIMAGRIAIDQDQALMAASLRNCAVGTKTAVEIGWLEIDP